jgi:hypothetical protein
MICIIHVDETRSAGFLILPENRWRRFVSGLARNPLRQFFGLSLKIKVDDFGDLGFKITAMVSLFGPQNEGEEICRFVPQN